MTRILLAEDDRISQTIAVAMLEQSGWQVTAVTNGREVLEELEHESYDLVLMDIHMPEMDGVEATRMIRNTLDNMNQYVPIIAMTAAALQRQESRGVHYRTDYPHTDPKLDTHHITVQQCDGAAAQFHQLDH